MAREEIVALMADRSDRLVIGIFGILKAGGAYLPIDPDYPSDRKKYMLEDSGVKVLLTDSAYLLGVGEYYSGGVFALDIQLEGLGQPSENPGLVNSSKDLAYVIYTSGSTGTPKGVMVEQRSVVRLVKNSNYISFDSHSRVLPTGSLSFDVSTFELWGPLLNGGSVYLMPQQELLSAETLKRIISKNDITTMWYTASWFNELVDSDLEIFNGLDCLLVGGDKLSPYHINRLIEKFTLPLVY